MKGNKLKDVEVSVSKVRDTGEMSDSSSIANDSFTTSNDNIKVIARFRPFVANESQSTDFLNIMPDTNSVVVTSSTNKLEFTFDKLFDTETRQDRFYAESVSQTVDDLLNGFHGTVLSYGQTGSGKTYTMMGDLEDNSGKGIIPRISEQLFEKINSNRNDIEYSVQVSYLEIYNENLRDLLTDNQNVDHKIVEDKINGIHATNLSTIEITCKEEIYELIKSGNSKRKVSATLMNQQSSRSHSIFQIDLKQFLPNGTLIKSKLHLVDLAGSEKVDKTGATGQSLEEAKKINSSLSALGNVINALTDGRSTHIPYRDSKLTRILQESLGGNSRTTLIINCSPSVTNEQETTSTLRFGSRAKRIKNHAHINQDLDPNQMTQQIKALEQERVHDKQQIEELKKELEFWKNGGDQLIDLKLKVAELETTQQSLINDLKFHVERNVKLQIFNDELIDEISSTKVASKANKTFSSLEKKFSKLSIDYNKMKGKNDQLNDKISELKRKLETGSSESTKVVQRTPEKTRGTKTGLNLHIMKTNE